MIRSQRIIRSLSSKLEHRSIVVNNPFGGEQYCEISLFSPEDAMAKLQKASEVQKKWATTSLQTRKDLCEAVLKEMEKSKEAIAKDISGCMGKPLKQAMGEIGGVNERATAMIDLAESALSDEILPEKPGFFRKIAKEPVGVVLTIAPWNYPLLCAGNSVFPAILAGNASLLKHASITPLVAEWFEEVFARAGAPDGLVTAIHASHATIDTLIQDRAVGSVVFTGSVPGGISVNQSTARRRFIDATLELGGKDPAYVAPDCDLDQAVDTCVDAAMYNAGQSCCAIERVYVHEDIANAFLEKAVALAEQHVLGDPMDAATTMGPMAQESGVLDCVRQTEDAVAKGAKLLTGGKRTQVDGKGRFFQPTVISGCNHTMEVMKEETFGPILPIQIVKSDEEALSLMNDSDYGLTAAIFTSSMDRYNALAPHVQTGTIFRNRADYLDPYLPWTGVKDTGKGISLSVHGFRGVTKVKGYHARL